MKQMHVTQPQIRDIAYGEKIDGYTVISLITDRGTVECRYYGKENSTKTMIWVGGIGGSYDTPVDDLYPDMSLKLLDHNISSLRVKYRHSTILPEATYDVLAGLEFLKSKEITTFGLCGWSFGGAVVIQAGVISQLPRTVITIASQGYGADIAGELPQNCSLLLLHGDKDETLAAHNSHMIYLKAHEPKKIYIFEMGRHGLSEVKKEVKEIVFDWVITELS